MDAAVDQNNTTGLYTDDRRAPYNTPRGERLQLIDKMTFSPSYTNNSMKETVVIDFVENFNSQYMHLYPSRSPLLLTPVNECGKPKFICSYIRPTLLSYLELYDYQTCAKFVAGYIKYEDLEDHGVFPHRVMSPTTTLAWQVGNSIEMSNLLCSLLIAAGYDAAVVLGFSVHEVVTNDQRMVPWPEALPDEPLSEDDEGKIETTLNTRFAKFLKRRPKLVSQFDADREAARRGEGAADEVDGNDTPRHSDDGPTEQHCHAWVLLRPNATRKEAIDKAVFIEPSTGAIIPIDSSSYLRVEAIYNHQNYFLNMDPGAHPSQLSLDLYDLSNWEHVFLQDPRLTSEDESERAAKADALTTDTGTAGDILIDLPASWVDTLTLNRAQYENRYPGRSKVIEYRNAVVTHFADYADGELRVREVVLPDDLNPHFMQTHTFYAHRQDLLRRKSIYPAAEGSQKVRQVHEWYSPGRKKENRVEGLREVVHEPGVSQTLRFYWNAREDGLASRTQYFFDEKDTHPRKVVELYRGRHEDKLWYRSATYAPSSESTGAALTLIAAGGSRDHTKEESRTPIKMAEKYRRNPAVKASADVMKRTFIRPSQADGEIWVKYHYGKDCITHASRMYLRSADRDREFLTAAGIGGGAVDDTPQTEVVVMPLEEKPRAHELRDDLKALLEAEKDCTSKVRDRQIECREIFDGRNTSGSERVLSTYDTLRNRPQETEEERELLRREENRRLESRKDYLAPYIANLAIETQLQGDYTSVRLNVDNAKAVRDAALKDLKERLIQRGHIMQARMDKEKEELNRRQIAYQKNADSSENAKENDEYGKFLHQAAWRMKILDERLTQHINQASEKYAALAQRLANDPRLAAIYEGK